MKALETYTTKFSEYEKERGENAYTGEWKFLVEHFEGIDDFFTKASDRACFTFHAPQCFCQIIGRNGWPRFSWYFL